MFKLIRYNLSKIRLNWKFLIFYHYFEYLYSNNYLVIIILVMIISISIFWYNIYYDIVRF